MKGDDVVAGVPRHFGTKYIASLLAANGLEVRDERGQSRGMIAAVQPLKIDGKEVCTDSVLAELVEYAMADQMIRETETLTLKKAAFGAFESSMTPIPKYCFKSAAALKTVLVYSVPRFTLDDILNVCEMEYPQPYTYEKAEFYGDWRKTIVARLRSHSKPGAARFFRVFVELPQCLFPAPPRIGQRERKAFAALLLRTVEHHHHKGIHHDRVSDRTVFFPTPYQPLFLSNYAGVPSSMLADLIPPELLTDEAAVNYGSQCRDVYSLACICYRIMTAERFDGRRFTVESPRPLGVAANEIAHDTDLSFCFKTPSAALRSAASILAAAGKFTALAPLLFSRNSYRAWRKINQATGGLWRSIPIVGPFCDIFFPTRIARTLRYVLDKPWFLHYFFHKCPPSDRPDSRGPDITMLADAFKVRGAPGYRHFESAFNVLHCDSALKREAFGSIMEAGFSIKSAYRLLLDGKKMLLFSAMLIVVIGLSIVLRHDHCEPTDADAIKMPVAAQKKAAATISGVVAESISSGGAAETIITLPPVGRRKVALSKKKFAEVRAEKDSVKATVPATTSTIAEIVPMVRKVNEKTAVISVIGTSVPQATKDDLPAPKKLLFPAIGYRDIFIVTGVEDSCNPGHLYYSHDSGEDAVMISRRADATSILYLAHRSCTVFGSIETIRLCRYNGCDQTLYYEASGAAGTGKPVYVRSGDVIGRDFNRLRQFLKDRRSLFMK